MTNKMRRDFHFFQIPEGPPPELTMTARFRDTPALLQGKATSRLSSSTWTRPSRKRTLAPSISIQVFCQT